MSVVPGISYNIANAQSGLVFHLSSDNKSIVANPVDNSSRQSVRPSTASAANTLTILQWVLSLANEGGWAVQSVQTGQSIGFAGAPQEGVGLVVGDSSFARPWTITALAPAGPVGPAVSSPVDGSFRYDHPVLSL